MPGKEGCCGKNREIATQLFTISFSKDTLRKV